jgi:hypothetical protein
LIAILRRYTMDDKQLKAIEATTCSECGGTGMVGVGTHPMITHYSALKICPKCEGSGKQYDKKYVDSLLAEVKRLKADNAEKEATIQYADKMLKQAEKRCEAAIRDAANGCCATCKHHKWVNGKMTCNREGCKWEWRDIQESSDEI